MTSSDTAIDLNFINLDTTVTRQVIGCLGLLKSKPDPGLFVPLLVEAVKRFSRLSTTPAVVRELRSRLEWVQSRQFSLADHVIVDRTPVGDRNDLLQKAATYYQAELDSYGPPNRDPHASNNQKQHPNGGRSADVPKWRFVIFENESSPAFLYLTHHSITDGLGGLELISAVTTGSPANPIAYVFQTPSTQHAQTDVPSSSPNLGSTAARGRGGTVATSDIRATWRLLKELTAPRQLTPINGNNSDRRAIGEICLPIDQLKPTKDRYKLTWNDLFLSIFTRGMARYFKASGVPDISNMELKIIVPVNTRPRSCKNELGNHITGVGLTLPLEAESVEAHLQAISEKSMAVKRSRAVGAYAGIARAISYLPLRIQPPICRYLALRTTCICTNVPYVAQPRFFGGAQITELHGLPALMPGHGVGVSFLTYNRMLQLTVVSDPAIVQNPAAIIDCIKQALNELALEN